MDVRAELIRACELVENHELLGHYWDSHFLWLETISHSQILWLPNIYDSQMLGMKHESSGKEAGISSFSIMAVHKSSGWNKLGLRYRPRCSWKLSSGAFSNFVSTVGANEQKEGWESRGQHQNSWASITRIDREDDSDSLAVIKKI